MKEHDRIFEAEQARINAQIVEDVLYHGSATAETRKQITAALRAWMHAELAVKTETK